MKKERHVSGAPLAMRIKGKITDSLVLNEVTKKPGMAIFEIAEKLGWTNGKVDGSVNRLTACRKISVKHYLKKGMLLKKAYPRGYTKPSGIIEIPKETIDSMMWKDNVSVYALTRSTIGLSGTEIAEWDERALFKDCIPIEQDNVNLIIELPQTFCSFYQLENSEIGLSFLANCVLATVESILPVQLPSTYPEEATSVKRFKIILVGEIEQTSTSDRPLLTYPKTKQKEVSSAELPYINVLERKKEIAIASSSENKQVVVIPVE
jgi:hypothetical protein